MAIQIIENVVKAYLGNDDSPDISNPIHSTEVAKAYGFEGPLVGGVTVWGWATETILEALGNSWLSNGWAEYSFRQPTFPGDILTVRAIKDSDSPWESWTVDMVNQADVVSVTGKIGLGTAPWSSDFVRPANMEPTVINHKGNLSLETVETGLDWSATQEEFT
ncbi:MAG: MaoC family dehydratase, partial [Chloroflexota bacterium]|nr:MaoC family dehydratase [Chloroflexota bacterium]